MKKLITAGVLCLLAVACSTERKTIVVPGGSFPGGGSSGASKQTITGGVAGASVALPSNATNSGSITLTAGTNVSLPSATATVGPSVQITAPSGTTFTSPVLVTVPITGTVTDVNQVVVLQRNDSTGAIKVLRPISVDLAAGTAKVYVTSFSTFQSALVPNNAQIAGTYNAVAYLPDVNVSAAGDSVEFDIGAVSSDSKFTFDGNGNMTVVSGSEDAAILTIPRGSTSTITSSAKSPVNLNWTYSYDPGTGNIAITDHDGNPQHGVRNLDGEVVVFTLSTSGTEDQSRHIIVAVRQELGLDSSILKSAYNVLGFGTELQKVGSTDGKFRFPTFEGNAGSLDVAPTTTNSYALSGAAGDTKTVTVTQPGTVAQTDETPAHQLLGQSSIAVTTSGHLDFGPRKGVVSANGSLLFLQDAQNASTFGRHVFACFERSGTYDFADLVGSYRLVGLSRDFEVFGDFVEVNHTTWKGKLTIGSSTAQLTERAGDEGRLNLDLTTSSLTAGLFQQTITRASETWTYTLSSAGRIEFDTGAQKVQGLAAPDGSLIVFVVESETSGRVRSELWYALRVTGP